MIHTLLLHMTREQADRFITHKKIIDAWDSQRCSGVNDGHGVGRDIYTREANHLPTCNKIENISF